MVVKMVPGKARPRPKRKRNCRKSSVNIESVLFFRKYSNSILYFRLISIRWRLHKESERLLL